MKKLFVLFFASLLLSASTDLQAQRKPNKSPKTPEERAAKVTKMMSKRLKLSTEQTAQLGSINSEAITQSSALRAEVKKKKDAGESFDRKPYAQQMRDIHQTRDTKTIALLTDAQKIEYETFKQKLKEKAKKRKEEKVSKKAKKNKDKGLEDDLKFDYSEDDL